MENIESKKLILNAVKKLNETCIKAYNFSQAWSVRSTHIDIINDKNYVMKIYLNGNGDLGQYWEESYFHDELNRYNWKIIDIRIHNSTEIEITLNLGEIFNEPI